MFYQVKTMELNVTRLASQVPPASFCTLKIPKIVGGRGAAPDNAGGAYDAPTDPLVGWGGASPLPIPHPLGACGASFSFSVKMCTPLLNTFRRPAVSPPFKNPGSATDSEYVSIGVAYVLSH